MFIIKNVYAVIKEIKAKNYKGNCKMNLAFFTWLSCYRKKWNI